MEGDAGNSPELCHSSKLIMVGFTEEVMRYISRVKEKFDTEGQRCAQRWEKGNVGGEGRAIQNG